MNIKSIFDKLLGSGSIKLEEPKPNKMEILSFEVANHKESKLNYWSLPECKMSFVAKNGKVYTAISEFSDLTMYMEINIEGLDPEENRLIARLDEPGPNEFGIKYERIDVQENLGNLGIGYALQEMMNKIFFLVAEENNVKFSHIHGVIGTNCNDTPEYSMPLYASFDKKSYNGHKLMLNHVGFDTINCNLEYFID